MIPPETQDIYVFWSRSRILIECVCLFVNGSCGAERLTFIHKLENCSDDHDEIAMCSHHLRCLLCVFDLYSLSFILEFHKTRFSATFGRPPPLQHESSYKTFVLFSVIHFVCLFLLFFVTGHSPIQRFTETSNSIVCPTPTLINLNGFTFRFLFFIR